MADLARMREVLDEAAEAIDTAVQAAQLLLGRAQLFDKDSPEASRTVESMEGFQEEIRMATRRVAIYFRRVALLVGRDDALTKRLGELQETFVLLEQLAPVEIARQHPRESEDRQGPLIGLLVSIRLAQFGFLDLAQKRCGARIPGGDLSAREIDALHAETSAISVALRELSSRALSESSPQEMAS